MTCGVACRFDGHMLFVLVTSNLLLQTDLLQLHMQVSSRACVATRALPLEQCRSRAWVLRNCMHSRCVAGLPDMQHFFG